MGPGGNRRQLGGNAAGSAITAVHAASNTSRRSIRHWKLEERKKKGKEQWQPRRQRRYTSAAMADAAEQHCPPGQMWA